MGHIGLDTAVYCNGNYCGVSRHLIIQPKGLHLTYLVVLTNHFGRMVPISMMAELSEMGVHLNCSKNELENLTPFTETHFREVPVSDFGLLEDSFFYPISGEQTWMHVPIVSYNTPPGEFIINHQTQIEAVNGHVGQFKELIIDPDTHQITHLVFQRGHLWERKFETVAAFVIDRLEGDTIFLNLRKADL
jgi:hypothetical protein